MAEYDRLLGDNQNPEAGRERETFGRTKFGVCRERTAKVLDSAALHKSVIALARHL